MVQGVEEERARPHCANCAIEIEWAPTIVAGDHYCCVGCARGGPCSCDYSDLPQTPIILAEETAERRGEATARFWRR